MSMPLDLYVIRHGESEANVIVQAGEQGDNSPRLHQSASAETSCFALRE